MNRPLVFVARRIPEIGLRLLAEHASLRIHEGDLPPTRDELIAGVAGCRGILSLLSDRIDQEVMDSAGSSLMVISNFAVGTNNIDVAQATRRGIRVGNTPDVLTHATADLAVALLLAVARNLPQGSQSVHSGGWKTWEPLGWMGTELRNKTIGIVGMGRIGLAVAERLVKGWEMSALYTARHVKPDAEALGARRVALPELLSRSDFVSVHVPLSETTQHLIGREELRGMRPGAILINTARGEVIDQEALVDALRERTICGAGLDVCTPEPLPLDHPLLSLDNCLIVPHIGSATVEARNAMSRRAAANLIAGLAGDPLPHPVNSGDAVEP